MTDWLAPLGVLILAGAISAAIGDTNARRFVLICAGLLAAGWTLRRLSAPVGELTALIERGGGEFVTPLVKGIAVAWAAWLASLVLRELGAANAASVAELVGAAQIAVLAAPFVARLVSAALALV